MSKAMAILFQMYRMYFGYAEFSFNMTYTEGLVTLSLCCSISLTTGPSRGLPVVLASADHVTRTSST